MVDRTADLRAALERYCSQAGLSQAEVTQIRSALALRPTRKPSQFTTFAAGVAGHISALTEFVSANKRDYILSGKLSNADKDRIEAEVGLFVRTCTQQIERLKGSVLAAQAAHSGSTAAGGGSTAVLSPHALAHFHGVVLILAERLHGASASFDRARASRYQQLLEKQALLGPKPPVFGGSGPGRPPQPFGPDGGAPSSSLPSSLSHQQHQQGSGLAAAAAAAQQQQSMALAGDSALLGQQLVGTATQVKQLEKTMRQIATINQMFSTAVQHQAEQIETIYNAAVEATSHVVAGNDSLAKTVEINRTSRLYVLILFIAASLLVLFFDWFNS